MFDFDLVIGEGLFRVDVRPLCLQHSRLEFGVGFTLQLVQGFQFLLFHFHLEGEGVFALQREFVNTVFVFEAEGVLCLLNREVGVFVVEVLGQFGVFLPDEEFLFLGHTDGV